MGSSSYLFHLQSRACPNHDFTPSHGPGYFGEEGGLVEPPDNEGWFSRPFFILLAFFIMGPPVAMGAYFTFLLTSALDVTTPPMWEPARFLSQVMPAAVAGGPGSPSSIAPLILGSVCTFLVGWVTLLICKSVSKWTLIVSLRLLKYALRFLASALQLAWATLFTLRCQLFYAIFHASCQCNHSSLGLIVLLSVTRDPLLYLLHRPASLLPACSFRSTVFLTGRVVYLSLKPVAQWAPSVMMASLAFVRFMCTTPIHALVFSSRTPPLHGGAADFCTWPGTTAGRGNYCPIFRGGGRSCPHLGDDRSEDGSSSSEDSEDDDMTPGLLQGLAEDLYGRFGDAERQFITNIGGGFDFSSGDGARLREVPRRPDGSCLYYSLLETDEFSLADGLRHEINKFIKSESESTLGTTTVLRAIQTEIGTSQTVFDYTNYMSEQKAWGGAIEIAIFSLIRSVPVKIFMKASSGYVGIWHYGCTDGDTTSAICLLYDGTHYSNLEPEEAFTYPRPLEIHPCVRNGTNWSIFEGQKATGLKRARQDDSKEEAETKAAVGKHRFSLEP